MERYRAGGSAVRYNVYFATPFFELPQQSSDVLRALYVTISKHWVAASRDIRIETGSSVEHFSLVLSLFRGSGEIRLNPDGMSASFENVGGSDFDIVVAVIASSLEALSGFVPATQVSDEVMRFETTLFLEGGKEAQHRVLQLIGPTFQAPSLSHWTSQPVFKMNFTNDLENWFLSAEVAPRWHQEDALWLSFALRPLRKHQFRHGGSGDSGGKQYLAHVKTIQEAMANAGRIVTEAAGLQPISE